MMMKEVLLLSLVVWMIMPAHPWKSPDNGSKNGDDTSEIDVNPSAQATRRNRRALLNYMLHGHGYWDPTGPEISRQLRDGSFKEKSAWEKCNEISNENKKSKGSKNTNDKLNIADIPSSQNSKKNTRAFRNFMLHGHRLWNPSGQEILRQLRGPVNKHNSGEEDVKNRKKIPKPAKTKDIISFEEYKSKFNKKYENEAVEKKRKTIFLNNMKEVAVHNKLYYSGNSSYWKGYSKFSDMTNDEAFEKLTCGKEHIFPADQSSSFREERKYIPQYKGKKLEYVNYSKCGATNAIRDQGEIASCWAFSVTSSIESQIFLKSKTLPILSEQYLIDCCDNCYECHKSGCKEGYATGSIKHGWQDRAIICVKLKGIALGGKYYRKYTGRPLKCSESARISKTPYKVSGMRKIKQSNEDELKKALVQWGPISIIINAPETFSFRTDGVLDDKLCGPQGEVNHAVVLVGYGTEKSMNVDPGKDYWLIRNSWGDTVGDEGYFKLTRDGYNDCDDSTEGYIPIISGYTSTI